MNQFQDINETNTEAWPFSFKVVFLVTTNKMADLISHLALRLLKCTQHQCSVRLY